MDNRSAKEVKAELERLGLSATEWARINGIKPYTVQQLLAGKARGKRGEAHRAAVLLGMKAQGEIVDPQAVRGKLFAGSCRDAA